VITDALQEALMAIIVDPRTSPTLKEMANERWDEVHNWHADIKQAMHVALMEKNKKQHKSQEE
jgi:hypothetical protein